MLSVQEAEYTRFAKLIGCVRTDTTVRKSRRNQCRKDELPRI